MGVVSKNGTLVLHFWDLVKIHQSGGNFLLLVGHVIYSLDAPFNARTNGANSFCPTCTILEILMIFKIQGNTIWRLSGAF